MYDRLSTTDDFYGCIKGIHHLWGSPQTLKRENNSSGRLLCRSEHEGPDNGRKPEHDTQDPEDEGDGQGGCPGIGKDDKPEQDGEDTQDPNAPSLSGKGPVQGNKPVDQGDNSHHDGEYKRHDEGAVVWIGKDQEAEDDTQESKEDLHSPIGGIRKGADQGKDSAHEPVGTKEDDDHHQGLKRVCNQIDPQDKGNDTLQEEEPPGEEAPHRVAGSSTHFS